MGKAKMMRQKGFTLIELAIVLVIIGLLMGGVLKGQELINSAKVKNMAADFRNVPIYIYGYQDKFRALPGDDKAAVSHVGVTTDQIGNGDGVIKGDWNSTSATDESVLFWLHVRKAGLAPGDTTMPTATAANNNFFPTNSEGGRIGVSSTSPITNLKGQYYMCSDGISGKFASQIDTMMDDGHQATGSMQAMQTNTANGQTGSTDYDVTATYTLCMAF